MLDTKYLILSSVLLLIMVIDPYIDYRQIKSGKQIHYPSHNIILGILALGLFGSAKFWGFSWGEVLSFAVVFPFVRWFLHDLILNKMRGLPFHYLGTRAKTDQVLRFFRYEMGIPSLLVRFIALLISISFAINILCTIR